MINKNSYSPLQILAISAFVVLALFTWQGNKGFNIWDEGFLWYGVQRVMLGEVPIRDFMAYDPGRYYWSAGLMSLWGDNGIMALRGSVAIFQAMGLFVSLILIARTFRKQNIFYLLLSSFILVLWMFPRHKLFDISLSIFLIGVLAFLIESPTVKRYFLAGFYVGLIAVFGRNHGMYGVAGSIGVMVWMSLGRVDGPVLIKGSGFWAVGIAVGFTPIFFMALLVPDFTVAFWESIRFLFEQKATNLPLPIPWPWRVNFNSIPTEEAIRGVLVGLLFIAIGLFGMLSIVWVVWQKYQNKQVSPTLVATSFLALPYAHFAYSRADVSHLAQGIFPLLVGCLALLATQPAKVKWPLVLILCVVSLWVMHAFQPGWQCGSGKRCVDIEISDSHLKVDQGTAANVELLRNLVEQYAPEGQDFIVTPFWPGAYPLFDRKAPTWEVFALFPRSRAFQQAEIERIKEAQPAFAFILDIPLDGRDELRFRNTHPLINQYIMDHFKEVTHLPNPDYLVYKAPDDMQ